MRRVLSGSGRRKTVADPDRARARPPPEREYASQVARHSWIDRNTSPITAGLLPMRDAAGPENRQTWGTLLHSPPCPWDWHPSDPAHHRPDGVLALGMPSRRSTIRPPLSSSPFRMATSSTTGRVRKAEVGFPQLAPADCVRGSGVPPLNEQPSGFGCQSMRTRRDRWTALLGRLGIVARALRVGPTLVAPLGIAPTACARLAKVGSAPRFEGAPAGAT